MRAQGYIQEYYDIDFQVIKTIDEMAAALEAVTAPSPMQRAAIS